MKDFLLYFYKHIGLQSILIATSAIIVIILMGIIINKISKIEKTQKGIYDELNYLRKKDSLSETGRGTYI